MFDAKLIINGEKNGHSYMIKMIGKPTKKYRGIICGKLVEVGRARRSAGLEKSKPIYDASVA